MKLPFRRLRADARPPSYGTAGAAGLDVSAALDAPLAISPGAFVRVPTGIALAIPEGYEVQVRPRSGLAARHGVTVLNAPGTIDSDYRGELQVLLINHGPETYEIAPGERIAQLVLAAVVRMELEEHDALDETARAEGGFGSTGRT